VSLFVYNSVSQHRRILISGSVFLFLCLRLLASVYLYLPLFPAIIFILCFAVLCSYPLYGFFSQSSSESLSATLSLCLSIFISDYIQSRILISLHQHLHPYHQT
jgi:hypothetical protein